MVASHFDTTQGHTNLARQKVKGRGERTCLTAVSAATTTPYCSVPSAFCVQPGCMTHYTCQVPEEERRCFFAFIVLGGWLGWERERLPALDFPNRTTRTCHYDSTYLLRTSLMLPLLARGGRGAVELANGVRAATGCRGIVTVPPAPACKGKKSSSPRQWKGPPAITEYVVLT